MSVRKKFFVGNRADSGCFLGFVFVSDCCFGLGLAVVQGTFNVVKSHFQCCQK